MALKTRLRMMINRWNIKRMAERTIKSLLKAFSKKLYLRKIILKKNKKPSKSIPKLLNKQPISWLKMLYKKKR